MQHYLLKILNATPEEAEQVLLLLAKGFCMGIFLAAFEVTSSTLFLNHFDEQKDLPIAFIVSGLQALLATHLFNYLQRRMSFGKLSTAIVASIVLCVMGLRIGFYLLEDIKPLVFIAFTLIVPFTLTILLVFWGIFGRIFNPKQAKRIVSGIDVGQLFASIVALFTIPFILTFLSSTHDLFWISAASVFFDLVLTIIITRKLSTLINNQTHVSVSHQMNPGYKNLYKDKYLLLMSSFIIISVMGVFFIDYSFLSVVAVQFPETKDLANFLSIFSGTIVIFIFLFQTFITNRIITEHGLRTSLLVTPLLLGFFTLIAIIVGSFFGYTPTSPAFLLFFLAVAMSKLFTKSLKEALDTPVFKLYFLPIDISVRFDIQAKIEGVVIAFAGLLAGCLQMLIETLQMFELVHYSFFMVPIVVGWVLIINQMHGKYKDTLQQTLSNTKKITKEYKNRYSAGGMLELELEKCKDPDTAIRLINLMEVIAPEVLKLSASKLAAHSLPQVGAYIQENRKAFSGAEQDDEVFKEKPRNTMKGSIENDIYTLREKIYSEEPHERVEVSRLLRENGYLFEQEKVKEYVLLLLTLLHDTDLKVRKEAILAAQQLKRPETWPFLIDMLAVPNYSRLAKAALIEGGEDVLDYLEHAFYKSGQDDELMINIIKIYGQIGGEKAIELLWRKLDFPDQKLAKEVLYNFSEAILKEEKYQLKGEKSAKVCELIEEEVSKAAWNLAALTEIIDEPSNLYLKKAIQEQIEENFDNIYLLLSLIYDPYSIELVRENIESDTTEGTAFALELMDIFLAPELKKILFPLMEDIPVAQKVNILQEHFPRKKFNGVEIIHQILNRDFNKINRWTKAAALYSIVLSGNIHITDDVLAQLFNPDPLLREMATWAICKKDRAGKLTASRTYQKISPRLDEAVKAELEWLFNYADTEAGKPLRISRMELLRKIPSFAGLPGRIVVEVAEVLKERRFTTGEDVFREGESGNLPICIIARGEVSILKNNQELSRLRQHNVFGNNEEISGYSVVATEDSVIYEIERLKLLEMTKQDHKVIHVLINVLKNQTENTLQSSGVNFYIGS